MNLKPEEVLGLSRLFQQTEKSEGSRDSVSPGVYKVVTTIKVEADLLVKEDGERVKEEKVEWKKLALALIEKMSVGDVKEVLKSGYADRSMDSFGPLTRATYEGLSKPHKEKVRGSVSVVVHSIEKV